MTPSRFSRALILVAALMPGVVGCQTGTPSVQLDRPAPSLAMERAASQQPQAESAIQQTGAVSEPRLVELSQREEPQRDSTWTKLLGRFGKPKRIPLPRTDLEADPQALAGQSEPAVGAF